MKRKFVNCLFREDLEDLSFDQKRLKYWFEYFGLFQPPVLSLEKYFKSISVNSKQDENQAIVQQLVEKLETVAELRAEKNEL